VIHDADTAIVLRRLTAHERFAGTNEPIWREEDRTGGTAGSFIGYPVVSGFSAGILEDLWLIGIRRRSIWVATAAIGDGDGGLMLRAAGD